MCAQLLSHVLLFSTPWTIAHQAPLSMGFSRQEYWSGVVISSSRESYQLRDWIQVSCISWICRWILYHHTTEEVLYTAMSVRVQISLRYLFFTSFRYIPRSEIAGPYGSSTCHMVVTKCGPMEKGMANHFSILALRTPWTVWKGKNIGHWKMKSSGQ